MPNEVAFIHSELGGKMNLVELLLGTRIAISLPTVKL
jgi:hypothetical protein